MSLMARTGPVSSRKLICASILALTLLWAGRAEAADPLAIALLREAVAAQGGEANLRGIRSVRWEAVGYRNMLEQSERPEGPYIVEHQNVAELHDHEAGRYRATKSSAVYPAFKATSGMLVDSTAAARLSGTRQTPGSHEMVPIARQVLALSPERLLLTALRAPDLRLERPIELQSVPQDVVVFTFDGAPVRIYLNRYTRLPTAMDYAGHAARSDYWRYVGDVTMRTSYSFWTIAKGGVRLPMHWEVARNGLPDASYAISKLLINAPAQPGELEIAPAVRAAFASMPSASSLDDMPFGSKAQPASEPVSGIVVVPGSWYVTFVRQDDGIVVVEAPISSGYSAKAIAEAERRFPGVPIKAVITTSDAWPHVAGIREYIARGVPIYALDLNAPILRRFAAASRKARPDALARSRRAAKWRLVDRPTTIGTGPNRLILYPIRGETSERQLMIYFPQHGLLYGSDAFQVQSNGSFSSPQGVSEVLGAATREGLKPSRFFMMHVEPRPWNALDGVIADAGSRDTPTGEY